MSQVIVGVKRVSDASIVENPDDPASGAFQTIFVLIDGREVPGVIQATSCETSANAMQVTVTFIADEYRTIDYRHKERYLLDKAMRSDGV